MLLICFLFNACAALTPATESPSELTRQAATPAGVAETPSRPALDKVETTSEQVPVESRLGQLFVQYPILLQPGASKTVSFHISIPAEIASLSPDSIKRDVRQPDNPRPLGRYTEYTALILVSQSMRVELVAPNFVIDELYPSEQELDFFTPNAVTNWGWTITAPNTPNEYVLVIKVYMSNKAIPIWVGSFDIVVEAPTPAPLPTLIPTPTPISITDRILQNIADNAVTLIGALLTTIVAIIGLYLQQRKPKVPKK
jgi:hypothetical protein